MIVSEVNDIVCLSTDLPTCNECCEFLACFLVAIYVLGPVSMQTVEARQRVYKAILQAKPPHLKMVYAQTQVGIVCIDEE